MIEKQLEQKPLISIWNKYQVQWGCGPPVNFFSVELLRKLLEYLTLQYTIIYKRYTGDDLKDWEDKELNSLKEKDMIRSEFPDVILFEYISQYVTGPDDTNLLMFSLLGISEGFIIVQGGMPVIMAYFGKPTLI